ncbi:uncharacterized protein KQ657_000635 [Scheffersomyces spartinae]|uniref:SWIRM domain-containing protein n=1 Tax=Scheffersomyces spartinae TaxID=45513 RepID=A0A9P7V944_9ASCO|nr:uncharacterized protein KQ657_000635 [Scheffersomyces spartinae]KAG7193566.1 hypothetical protein KQ657_000635 [Scheffersomyces spartinae]
MIHQPIAAAPKSSPSTTSHPSNLSSVRDVPICLTPTHSDLHPQNNTNKTPTNSNNNANPGDSRFTPLLLASPSSTSATLAKPSQQPPLTYKQLASSSSLASVLSLTTITKNSPSSSNTILSPPLSPYHRSGSDVEELKLSPYDVPYQPPTEEKQTVSPLPSFLNTLDPFPVEDFSNYRLTISPWGSSKSISGTYKSKHLNFLDQYGSLGGQQIAATSSLLTTTTNLPLRYLDRKYKRRWNNNSDLESDYASDRPRTRRVVKELSLPVSDLDTPRPVSVQSHSVISPKVSGGGDFATPPPAKKRRAPVRDYSPITIQQQLLIDESIPDYSPSTDTLPNNTKCLKVEWKGQPMDLRSDPNLSKLHPAEVVLASTLRLPCNVYLDLKRRLFFEKVERLRHGKQFRRTDAQKACRIDVNKALRLFAVFEKVGWLNDDLFVKYL